FNCGEVGHISRYCPNNRCKICGQWGHVVADCRRPATAV
ncbi:unnamed protein product, partial [Sphacelaria rigidula]